MSRKRRKKPTMRQEPMTDTVTVDNPAEYAERMVRPVITATRTLRDDPIGQMAARGHLGRVGSEDANGRIARARLFQETWEASGRGMIRSPDFAGASGSDPTKRSGVTDRQLAAARQLDRWQSALGKSGFDLLTMILIDKATIAEAARRRHGVVTKAVVTFTGHRLRECLDAL